MCEYLKLKIEIFKFEISMWNIWNFDNLKIEMSKFGCVNTKSWKLKCLKTKYWKLNCLNTEN
jgi:hypothetical protein